MFVLLALSHPIASRPTSIPIVHIFCEYGTPYKQKAKNRYQETKTKWNQLLSSNSDQASFQTSLLYPSI